MIKVMCLTVSSFLFTDGVVFIDPDYIKNRKVFGNVCCCFRYGREDLDVLGLTFRKELYSVTKQIYPRDTANERPITRLQVRYSIESQKTRLDTDRYLHVQRELSKLPI